MEKTWKKLGLQNKVIELTLEVRAFKMSNVNIKSKITTLNVLPFDFLYKSIIIKKMLL